jgi:hypothetical protein
MEEKSKFFSSPHCRKIPEYFGDDLEYLEEQAHQTVLLFSIWRKANCMA